MRISEYILDSKWDSFIENSIKKCTSKKYPQLLTMYLEKSEEYNLTIDYQFVPLVFELLTNIEHAKHVNPKDMEGVLLHAIQGRKLENNYVWPNAIFFLNKIFTQKPEYFNRFIASEEFYKYINDAVIANNVYIHHNKTECSEFNSFMEKTMQDVYQNLGKNALERIYNDNKLYISKNVSPSLNIVFNKTYLELNLPENNLASQHKKNKL